MLWPNTKTNSVVVTEYKLTFKTDNTSNLGPNFHTLLSSQYYSQSAVDKIFSCHNTFWALLCHYGKRHCQFSHKKPTFFQYCCAFKLSLLLKSSCRCFSSFRKENNFESQSNLLWGRNMGLQRYVLSRTHNIIEIFSTKDMSNMVFWSFRFWVEDTCSRSMLG